MNVLKIFNITFNIMVLYFICVLGRCDYNEFAELLNINDVKSGIYVDLCQLKNQTDNDFVVLSTDICIGMPLNDQFLQLGDTLYSLGKRRVYFLEVFPIDNFKTTVHHMNKNSKRKKIFIEYSKSSVANKADNKQYMVDVDHYTFFIGVYFIRDDENGIVEGDFTYKHHDNGTLTIMFTDVSTENINSLKLCDIYKDKCINGLHYSIVHKNMSFFTKHSNLTIDTRWNSVGKFHYCGNGTCHAAYTMKIDQSTQFEYGNEKSTIRSSTIGNSESISSSLIMAVYAGFSALRIEFGGSVEGIIQLDKENSFEITNTNGETVSYSISTANTVGLEESLTCIGIPHEKISIEARTNKTHITGNDCVYVKYDKRVNQHAYKCNYVDLKMYPVKNNQYIVNELQCKREMMNF